MTEDEENTFLFELQRADTDAENEKLKKQLTEAKEIIRDLLEWQKVYGQASGKYKHRCDEARAFLKESENE